MNECTSRYASHRKPYNHEIHVKCSSHLYAISRASLFPSAAGTGRLTVGSGTGTAVSRGVRSSPWVLAAAATSSRAAGMGVLAADWCVSSASSRTFTL